MSSQYKNQEGAVLLLALLVMFAISLAGMVISLVVLSQLKISRNIVDYTQAYYAADAGLEKSLYKIKMARIDQVDDLADVKSMINSFQADDFLNKAEFTEMEAATYALGVGEEDEGLSFARILPDESVQYNYYDPDHPTDPMGVEYFWPFWTDDCDGLSKIEISLYRVGDLLEGEENYAEKVIYDCGGIAEDESGLCNATIPSVSIEGVITPPPALTAIPNSQNSYIVRVKSIQNPAASLAECSIYFRLLALDDFDITELLESIEEGGWTAYINLHLIHDPNLLRLVATGESGNSEVTREAILSWVVPVSGLADFVLFSETTIEKTIE